jgi:RNA polymerase sigma factor (sigma-70 family)
MTESHSQSEVQARRQVDAPKAAAQSRNEPTDDELLKRYHSARDEAAFALLVNRYSPLVWHACCRILRNVQDAEDAFQATFLVLHRKAGSVRWQKSIAGWIYEVSHRVAKKSRTAGARRIAGAGDDALATVSAPARDDREADRRVIVEEEIDRLPESLRVPIVMCYLQGLTNAQAARRIGCVEGTVVSRLARAREKLRRRLKARGVAMVGGAALAGWLAEGVSAAVPAKLLEGVAAITTLSAKGVTSSIISWHAAQLARDVARQLAGWKLLQVAGAITLGTAVVAPVLVYEFGLWSRAAEPKAPPAAVNERLILQPFDDLAPPAKAALGADVASKRKAERLESMKRTADRYELVAAGDETTRLDRVPEPVLRWTNPVRGAKDGCLFLWTEEGRPAAILSLYPPFGGSGDRWDHEFLSLSRGKLLARRDGTLAWTPEKPGIAFKPVPGAAAPAQSAARRLSQLRQMAANFFCTVTIGDDKSQLRLLTSPIHRYGDSSGDVLDGGLFAFAQGTDPELLLLLEAGNQDGSPGWQYALARLTFMGLEARYVDEVVWSASRWDKGEDPRQPYLTIRGQPAD